MKKIIIVSLLLLFAKVSLGQYTYNKAAVFNGSRSYFSIPSSAKLNFTTAIKIEAWIKPTATRIMTIVGKNFQTGYFFGLGASNQLRFYKANTVVESIENIPVNVWTHVGVTYNGVTTRFFINGEAVTFSTAMSGAIPVNSDSLKIGADQPVSAYFFQGEMDDVSLWNSTDITWIGSDKTLSLAMPYPSANYAGLLASYRMNGDGNGTSIYDEVLPYSDGISRNVTYVDYSKNPTYHSSYNSAMYLGFLSGYLVSPNNSPYNSTTAITLEAWVRKDTTGTTNEYQDIVNKSGGTTRNNYNLAILGSALTFAINNTTNFLQYVSTSLLNGRWHHIAATYNSATGNAVLYLDGNQVAQSTFAGAPMISNDADSLFIGKMGASGFSNTNFKGELDEVRIWKNTERTAAEIKGNMFKNIDFTTPFGSLT